MDRPLIELSSHPDFSPHVYRVIEAISKMETEKLSEINLLRSAT